MKEKFNGVHVYEHTGKENIMYAWQFFYAGEVEEYETADGMKLYLAEVVD